MRNASLLILSVVLLLCSCSKQNALEKSQDFEYKYEVAKQFYFQGRYSRAQALFADVLAQMKGTADAEESLYLTGMCNFRMKDYESAGQYFKKYYQVYNKGIYIQQAMYFSGLSQYKQVADPRLDQQSTYDAIAEFQNFITAYPYSPLKKDTQDKIYQLQDRLVEKEYLAAKLYYDLGSYTMNCAYGGNNYEACVVTSQNALRDFPYANPDRRETFALMILRSKYHLALKSVESKRLSRYRDYIDEYYAFKNDYPESKYLSEAEGYFIKSTIFVNNHQDRNETVE